MQIIVFNNPATGKMSAVFTSPEWEEAGLQTLDEHAREIVPIGTQYSIVDNAIIPQDQVHLWGAFTANHESKSIDIDMDKAKNVMLDSVRKRRVTKFAEYGVPNKLRPSLESAFLSSEEIAQLEFLRNITEPLKELNTAGKINDTNLLAQINIFKDDNVFKN